MLNLGVERKSRGMQLCTLTGNSRQIGDEYGRAFANEIRKNLTILVFRDGYEPLPRQNVDFVAWMRNQEALIACYWPWLLDEMDAVAAAVGVEFEDILLLNLRAWQYNYYGAIPAISACSSLVITLDDGTFACAGALDDAPDYYCGAVEFVPNNGYGFITFPLTGTSWASRSINSKGLSVGISSQLLPGLRPMDNTINQDLAIRVISQTCAMADEVREFCREHPFTMNIMCVDAQGGVFCAHQTSAGLLEIPNSGGYCVITNHIIDDERVFWLRGHGVNEFPEDATTRPRRERLLEFAREHNGKCSDEDVRRLVSKRDDDAGTINNKGSIYITYTNPQVDPRKLWVMRPNVPGTDAWFTHVLRDL